jgi:hypothetical protein
MMASWELRDALVRHRSAFENFGDSLHARWSRCLVTWIIARLFARTMRDVYERARKRVALVAL